MTDTKDAIKKQIKENISLLIQNNRLLDAKQLLAQYAELQPDDKEIYSIKSVIFCHEGDLEAAEQSIQKGLQVDKKNFDLLYNRAVIFEQKQVPSAALEIYYQLTGECYANEQQILAQEAIARLFEVHPEIKTKRRKMTFLVRAGMDSFIGNIMEGLSGRFEVKKVIVTDLQQIDQEVQTADVCWFDWCDELVIYASRLQQKHKAKLICRLHSYEAFTNAPEQVNWKQIDHFILDSEHIKKIVLDKVHVDMKKITMIPVGIHEEKFTYKKRKKGFNVAYVGYINFKKGPMLLIHLLEALVKKDSRYVLHICGEFQDYRYVLYFEHMIQAMKLDKNLCYNGRVESVDAWLDDKDYILSTSLLEGQHITVMEGMCKGLKPIIHNFVGAKQLYRSEYVWNTIDEAVEMIYDEKYDSSEYRKFIINNYSNEQEMHKINQVLEVLGVL